MGVQVGTGLDWGGERFLEFNIKRNSLVHVPPVELKIQIAIPCLLKILIPLSIFSKLDKTDLKNFRHAIDF